MILMLKYIKIHKSTFIFAFFNTIIDKHQHMHFTFNNILVQNNDFNVKIHKNT